jgi:RNA:NAD 2'-phosphotransferase (TPT1/KptA family)
MGMEMATPLKREKVVK